MSALRGSLVALALAACTGTDPSKDEATDAPTDTTELIDGILLPDVDAVTWVDGVDNPWFPLPVGATWDYATEDGEETDHVEVLAERRTVNGVSAVVVYDVVEVDGEIAEETWDWYAQDSDGNVWYLGEDTCEYEDGACAVHHGAWEWGVDGAVPGVIMWGDPTVDGQPYFQEYLEGIAEDVGEVIAVGESYAGAAGTWSSCVRTRDTSHLDAALDEQKVYCQGVGNTFVHEPDADVHITAVAGL